MTLTEFLLARVAEDEAAARAAINFTPHWRRGTQFLNVDFEIEWKDYPARVLAECEAKRRVVGMSWDGAGDSVDQGFSDYDFGLHEAWTVTLRLLALPYANHPDYQQEWRP